MSEKPHLRFSTVDLPQGFGLGFLTGPQMVVLHVGYWHWRIDWTGRFVDDWRTNRPIRKGELKKGDLYDITKHHRLNPHLNAAGRDKYNEFGKPKVEAGWLARLRQWLKR